MRTTTRSTTKRDRIDRTSSTFVDLIQQTVAQLLSRRSCENSFSRMRIVTSCNNIFNCNHVSVRILHDHIFQIAIIFFLALAASIDHTSLDYITGDLMRDCTQTTVKLLKICQSYLMLPSSNILNIISIYTLSIHHK